MLSFLQGLVSYRPFVGDSAFNILVVPLKSVKSPTWKEIERKQWSEKQSIDSDTTQTSYNCSLLVKSSLWEVSLVNVLPHLENVYYDMQVPKFRSNFAIDAGFGT